MILPLFRRAHRTRSRRPTYLNLPGATGAYASAQDSAALSITGDLDLRWYGALADYTPLANQTLISKYDTNAQRSYLLRVHTDGRVSLYWSPDGATPYSAFSTENLSLVADGTTLWVRATLDVDNGSAGWTATFYRSSDGETWVAMGAAVTGSGATSIFDGPASLQVGAYDPSGATEPAAGKIFRAQVYNGIGGTLAFDADFTVQWPGTRSFTETAGVATVSLNGTAEIVEA